MGQGLLFWGSHLLVKMVFSMLSSELFWERGEYQVIRPAEEEPEAISELRSWVCRRKAECVPPCGRTAPPSQGTASEGQRYVPLQTAFQRSHIPGQLTGPEFLPWWAAWNEVDFNFLFIKICRRLLCAQWESLGCRVGWSEGANREVVEVQHKADPSGLLVLPQSKLLGTSYLLLRDNVMQKKGDKRKCWNTNTCSAVRAELQLGQRVRLSSILSCSSSKGALLSVTCLKGIINFWYFSSGKANGPEFPWHTPDSTGRLSKMQLLLVTGLICT